MRKIKPILSIFKATPDIHEIHESYKAECQFFSQMYIPAKND